MTATREGPHWARAAVSRDDADHGKRSPELGRVANAALAYARHGWSVFPVRAPQFSEDGTVRCSCRASDDCKTIGKHPRLARRDPDAPPWGATTDPATIRHWWTRWPTDNVAIATGAISGVLVLDVDRDAGGWDTVTRLEAEGRWEWRTARVLTPSGGAHFYFVHVAGIRTSTSTSRAAGGRVDPLGTGIDVRSDGGMVLAPPSQHRNGGRYVWQHHLVPGGDRHVARLP